MRQSLSRSGGVAGAVLLACTQVGTEEARAQTAPAAEGPPRATAAAKTSLDVARKQRHARVGRRLRIRGHVEPAVAGRRVLVQVKRSGRWRTLDRARTRKRGAFTLRVRSHRPLSGRLRVRATGTDRARRQTRPIGRLNVYRVAAASWYGPGLFGNRTGCGGVLKTSSVGVAHKQLPCGTKVTLSHRGRTIRVPVIDRGPYVGNREFDLTSAVAQKLRFEGHGPVLVTR
jgi:rare lipoprotein A